MDISNHGEMMSSAITAAAAEAGGGEITIKGGQFFYMLESQVETDVTGGQRAGGNVSIAHEQVLLNRANVTARADLGFGGDITIAAAELVTSADTHIDASSNAGLNGTITLASPEVDLESGLSQLPTDFLDASALLRPSCQARSGGEREGSFVVARRQGLPASPEGLLLAFDAFHDIGDDQPVLGAVPGALSSTLIASAEGLSAFRGGDFQMATDRLEQAAELCGDDPICRFDALRGIAQSQQALGRFTESIEILRGALKIVETSRDEMRIASALSNLGNAHVALGQPEVAAELLERGITLAMASGHAGMVAGMLNNQGNYYAAMENFDAALAAYLKSSQNAAQTGDRLHEAKALANAGRAALNADQTLQADNLLNRAVARAQQLPNTNDKVYVLIHLAKTWERLAMASPEQRTSNLINAHAALQTATSLARKMENDRALSYAMGNMGALYRIENRTTEALYLTRQALQAAERADAPESLYRWHWQEGKLLWDQGRVSAAINAYRRAVTILEETRQETASQYGSAEA